MNDFLLYSIIASVVLTMAFNLLPGLFPTLARRIQDKIEEAARQLRDNQQQDETPRVKVFFPWKVMLTVSVVLTLLVNLVSCIAAG